MKDCISASNSHICHHSEVIMGVIASQITSLTIVNSTVYSDADQRKYQSSAAALAFVWGIHRGPVNSPNKWPVTRKMFPCETSSCIIDRRSLNLLNKLAKKSVHQLRILLLLLRWRIVQTFFASNIDMICVNTNFA